MGTEGAIAPDKSLAALEGLLACRTVPPDVVRMRMGLLCAQRETLGRIPPGPSAQTTPISSSAVPFNAILLEKLLTDLVAHLRGMGAGNPKMDRLISVSEIRAGFCEIARCAAFEPRGLFLEDTAKRLDFPVDALRWIGRMLAAPFVTAAVRQMVDRRRIAELVSTHCPFCGSSPGLAILRRPDGRRMLACGLCGEWWTGDRVQCPFCESTSRWARLAGEEDRIRWIETCDGCRGYVKTIDERQLPEDAVVMPLAESVRTLELDLAAEKFGCTPNLPYAALV